MITSMLLLLGSSLSSLLVTLLMMESNWWKLNVPTNSWKKLRWSFDSNIEESEPGILWPYRTGSPWRSCQECPGAETRAPRTSRWGSPIIKISSRMLKMFLMKASQKRILFKILITSSMAPLTPDLAGRPTSRQQEWIFCFLYQILFLDLYALNCKIFCPDLEGELPAVQL